MIRYPLLACTLVACGHSEPFTATDHTSSGPFEVNAPLRLTYSPLGDHEPGLSTDGRWFTYQFERGSSDQDRCIAILPLGGGTRQQELCAWALDQAGRADALGSAALRADGAIAFTLHSGVVGNMTSTSAGLYVGTVDSVAGAVRVLQLPAQPPGAQSSWFDLVEPIWISDDELLALAGGRFLAAATGACDPPDCNGEWIPYDMDRTPLRDTIPLGQEIARIRITSGTATVTRSVPVPTARFWSHDPSSGKTYVVSQYVHPLDDFVLEAIADTVFAVDLGSGQLTALYGTSRVSGSRYLERIHGIASAQGRIFVSRSWRSTSAVDAPNILPGAQLTSDIAELLPDGTLQSVVPQLNWRWGRFRISADARVIYAEALERNSSDIYRIEIAP